MRRAGLSLIGLVLVVAMGTSLGAAQEKFVVGYGAGT